MKNAVIKSLALIPVDSLPQSSKSIHRVEGDAAMKTSKPQEAIWCQKLALNVGLTGCQGFVVKYCVLRAWR